MEYLILIGVVIAALLANKLRLLFYRHKDNQLSKQDKAITAEANKLKSDIAKLNKKLQKPYKDDMTPEQIEEFWRGKK